MTGTTYRRNTAAAAARRLTGTSIRYADAVGGHRAVGRDSGIDVCKGLAILAVVGIHVTGHFAPHLAAGGPGWATDIVVNRILEFAVPAFLMLGGCVIGRKLYALPPRQRLRAAWRRIPRIAVIYLAASAVYVADSSRNDHGILSLHNLLNALLWGKASYHLYFLVVLIQLIVVLPLATVFVRSGWSLGRVAAGGALLQGIIYAVNRAHPALYPGALIGWYALPCLVGVWLASRGDAASISRPTADRLFWATLIGLAAYLPFAVSDIAGVQVDGFLFQATNWAYTTAAALLLLAIAQRISTRAWSRPLAQLGRLSLAVYLMHPLTIELLDHLVRVGTLRLPVPAAMALYIAACVGLPILAVRCWSVFALAVHASAPQVPHAATSGLMRR